MKTRKGLPVSSQAFATILENQLYVGIVNAPGYGAVGKRGDFDPLIPDDVFYRVQAILTGRVHTTGPFQRRRPEFPLRAFIKCATCGRGVTASWSKGRSARYAYYHCLPPCRAVNITKARLEGLFVDELERFQPTPGYMRLLKESVLRVWHERKASVKNEVASAEQRAKAIQQKLDRLDDAFIYKESIDLGTYERQRDRLREELTLVEIDRHGSKVEEFDVEGILNFAERVLPRASDLWASLEQRKRLQRLFFPEGVAFSGKAFDRTVVTSSLFEYLRPLQTSNENLVSQNLVSWNLISGWLARLDGLRRAAWLRKRLWPAAMASAATLARDECSTALSIEHFSSRHSLSEKCFWCAMQSQQGDSVSSSRRPVLEPMIEHQAVWTD